MLFKLLILLLVLVPSTLVVGKEVGDIVYYPLSDQWGGAANQYTFSIQANNPGYVGHAMIYLGTDEDGNDYIIHAPGTENGVDYKSKREKRDLSDYDKYFTDTSLITNSKRRRIVSFANSKLDRDYPYPYMNMVGKIVKPTLSQQKGYDTFNNKECYSCVGIVERSYEEAGINITPDGYGRDLVRSKETLYKSWLINEGSYVALLTDEAPPYDEINGWVFSPYTQWYKQNHPYQPNLDNMRLDISTTENPVVEITLPHEREIIDKSQGDISIRATATDGDKGSGILKVEFYIDNVNSSSLIKAVYTYQDQNGDPIVDSNGDVIFYYENDSVPVELDEYHCVYDITNLHNWPT
ncbi:hypothetical protein KAU32_01120 [bacterium]|nr:hypothetical protein [bacterium]